MPFSAAYRPAIVHAALGGEYYDVVEPARFPRHILRVRNQPAAARVGLDELDEAEWIAHFGRFEALPGSFPHPLALRYHGHQFRSYNPDLGDGRGFLFAQLQDAVDGRLLDLGTKGSGTTPWSRGGDGRLTLKGGVREVLATAMLAALGVNTSRSFSLVETGEALYRGDEPSPTRSAVLVRLSHSHIRIGSFQRLAYLGQTEAIARLLDHTIRHYMPNIWADDLATRAAAFLGDVTRRVARTGAQWMVAGFVHGVLNTDNINVTGESFDYGPWRFLPTHEPGFTAAYFDHSGLYAYGRQPETLLWNLARLAGTLLPLAEKPALEAALGGFWDALHAEFTRAMLRRLGVAALGDARDDELARAFVGFLHDTKAPFAEAFFDWWGGLARAPSADAGPRASFYADPAFAAVRALLADYAPSDPGRLDNAFWRRTDPPNLLIEDVEAVWAPIDAHDDWTSLQNKLADIATLSEMLGMEATTLAGLSGSV